MLSNKQIDFIVTRVDQSSIPSTELKEDLANHLCSLT